MELQPNTLMEVREVMFEMYDMLVYRDRMNAVIHCQPLRKSPLTEKVDNLSHQLDKELSKSVYRNGPDEDWKFIK